MDNCEVIIDPYKTQLKVRPPLTKREKLADIPSHAYKPINVLTIFQTEICVSVQAACKELNESVNTNSL
jgi:hypothetical protein